MPTRKEPVDAVCSCITILAFLAVISTPLFFLDTEKTKSWAENKMLATFPAFKRENGKINKSFLRELDAYLSDRLGFKEEAILLDMAVSYRYLGKLKNPNYIRGNGEELFMKHLRLIHAFQARPIPETLLVDSSKNLLKMQRFFEAAGSTFLMVTIPDKENVYPEFYPPSVRRFSEETFFDRLSRHIQANTDIRLIHLKQALIDKKQEARLYYKNFDPEHWNENGIMVGYGEIMKAIAKEKPDIEVLNEQDFDVDVKPSPGTDWRLQGYEMARKSLRFDDSIYKWTRKGGYCARKSQQVPGNAVFDANTLHLHLINPQKTTAPKVLILGDSYASDQLATILAESFSELHFVYHNVLCSSEGINQLLLLYDALAPDIVIFQMVERMCSPQQGFAFLKQLPNGKQTEIEYANVPVRSELPHMWLQEIDTKKVLNGEIEVTDSQRMLQLKGAARDHLAKQSTAAVYAKVGEWYYKADPFAWERFAKDGPGYLNSGVTFRIPAKALREAGEVSFIAVAHDKSYRYAPVTMKVRTTEPVVAAEKKTAR